MRAKILAMVAVASMLAPSSAHAEKYSVKLTREMDGLYSIYGTDLYIRTGYCSQYGYNKEAIIDTKSKTVIFLAESFVGPKSCRFEMILKQVA